MGGGNGSTELQGNQLNNRQEPSAPINAPAPKTHAQILESYMGPYPTNLDITPVVTQELKDFAYKLPTILKQQAEINIYLPADAARLKSAYEVPDPENPGKTKIIERDMLTTFNFNRNTDGTRDFVPNKDMSAPLETPESVEKEVEGCNFNYAVSLMELEKEQPNADTIRQFYMLMAAAKSGHLSVIRSDMRGEYTPRSVYLHGSGKLEVMDRNMTPYVGSELSDKLHLDDEDLIYNRLLNEERRQVKGLDYTQLMRGGDMRAHGLNIAVDSVRKGNVTREQFIQSVMPTRGIADADFWDAFWQGRNNYANANKMTLPDFQPRQFSEEQQAERAELSKRAARTLFSNLYDIAYTQELGNEETFRGALPKDPGNGNRDIYKMLLQFGTDQATVKRNRQRLKQLSDSQDPKKTPVEQMRLRHDLINSRMKDMLAVDYDQFVNLNDEQLVNKWPEFQSAFESISVMRAAIDDEIRNNKDATINRENYEACRRIEDKYAGLYFEGVKRMSLIANPYYATVDPNQILSMSPQERDTIASISAVDGALKRFCTDMDTLSHSIDRRDLTAIQVDLQERGLIDSTDELNTNEAYWDGKSIVATQLNRRKGPYIISAKNDPDKVYLYQRDPKTGKYSEAPSESYDRCAYALRQVRLAAWKTNKAKNPVGDQFATAMITAPDEAMNTVYPAAFSEILAGSEDIKTRYDEFVQQIKERAHKQPRLNQDEFRKRIPGVGEKLSPEEVEKRRALSHAAQSALIDDLAASIKTHAAFSQYNEKIGNKDPRAIKYFLLNNPQNGETQEGNEKTQNRNESVLARIYGDESTPQSKKAAVEDVLKEYLSKKNLIERTYTDEELVQNWSKINGTLTAMGMEYKNFWRDVVEANNIEVDPKLVKESREMFDRAAVTSSYYQQRMKVIGNRYYQYGQEEAAMNNSRSLQDHDDPEWGALGRTYSSFNTAAASAEWSLTALDVGLSETTLDYAVNMEGKQLRPGEQNQDLITALHSNEPLLMFGKDGGVPKACRQIAGGVPPKTQQIDYLKTYFDRSNTNEQQQREAHRLYQLSYDARQENIEQSSMSPTEKKLKLNELEAHYKLDRVLYNSGSPNYAQELETAMVELAANIMINKAALGKGYKEELLQELGLDKARSDMVREMNKAGLGKYLMDTLPKEPHEIAAFSGEQLFEKITQATQVLQTEKTRAEEISKMDIKVEPDEVSNQLSEARRVVAATLPPVILGFKENEITSGTVNGNGVELNLNKVKTLIAANLFAVGTPMESVLNGQFSADPSSRFQAEIYLGKEDMEGEVHRAYLNGMNGLSKQIFDKMNDLKEFSIAELSKPENRNLLQATALLSEMRKALEQHDKDNQIEYPEHTENLRRKQMDCEATISGTVGTIMSGVPTGTVTGGNFENCVKNYMASNLLSWSLQQMKAQNGDRPMKDILNINTLKTVATTIQNEVLNKNSSELGLDKVKQDPEKMKQMLQKMQNDTAAKEMGVKLTAGGKLSIQVDKLFKPAKVDTNKKVNQGKSIGH